MIRYDPYTCYNAKKPVQISAAEYCNKVTYNQMCPFASTDCGKIYKWKSRNFNIFSFKRCFYFLQK